MGNNISVASGVPDAHIRIYKNLLQIQSPATRLQMLETLLAGQEYVRSIKQAGIYGPILSYIASIRRGDTSFLPGEQASNHQQQVQRYEEPTRQYSTGGVSRPTGYPRQQEDRLVTSRGDPGAHTKAITFFSQCLQIMGLEEEVALNEQALKAAYKKVSMKAHPDKGGSEEAFDQVTRAYAYLGEILRRVRGGRSGEMVNITEESPARLAGTREQLSESWKMKEPVKLNAKNLNMEVFNKVFEETRLPDPDGDGYGDWLKNPEGQTGGSSTKFGGKFNRSVFNEAFESEVRTRAQQSSAYAVTQRQPEALVMAPSLGIELGRERPDDFTGANLNGLKYTDLKKAYTSDSTFSHQVAGVQVSSRSYETASAERKGKVAPLTSAELESVAEGERYMQQRQANQAVRIAQEDKRITEHFHKLQKYVLTNQ
jgi:curved DNA-binding protein CbpA